jgi:hypothetical protein
LIEHFCPLKTGTLVERVKGLVQVGISEKRHRLKSFVLAAKGNGPKKSLNTFVL